MPHGDNHDLWIASNDGTAHDRVERRRRERVVQRAARRGPIRTTRPRSSITSRRRIISRIASAARSRTTPTCAVRAACPAAFDAASGTMWRRRERLRAGAPRRTRHHVRRRQQRLHRAGSTSHGILRADINAWPDNPMGHPASEAKYRFQWTCPIVLSPHDPHVLYAGGNGSSARLNEGQSWTRDLARSHAPRSVDARHLGRPDHHGPDDGRVLRARSSRSPSRRWRRASSGPGSDDGLLHSRAMAARRGATSRRSSSATSRASRASSRATSRAARRTWRRTAISSRTWRRYIWKTTDYGKSWTRHRRRALRPPSSCASCARIRCARDCCSPARSAACG